jgi:molybdate transport system substrate-binding protein
MKHFASLLLSLVILSACVSSPSKPAPDLSGQQTTLTVFAAASLTDAFGEMAYTFESSHPGVDVALNFAGSNTLRAQIEQGARADVFASANKKEMEKLTEVGLVNVNEKTAFLRNHLVVIIPQNNPAMLSSFEELSRPGLKLVLAAEEVPAGRYARQMLDNVGVDFKDQVLANVVSNETDVKQVVTKVQLGEADAGIVYASDAVAAPELSVIEIPAKWNVLAEYPIASLENAPNPELADEFITFVLSPEGGAILQKWGFTPIPRNADFSPQSILLSAD